MAKSTFKQATDAVKSVAGAALGAAAAAATVVVVTSVAGAMKRGGQRIGEAAPALEKAAADKVSQPLLPTRPKRAAAKKKVTVAKKKVAAAKKKSAAKRK